MAKEMAKQLRNNTKNNTWRSFVAWCLWGMDKRQHLDCEKLKNKTTHMEPKSTKEKKEKFINYRKSELKRLMTFKTRERAKEVNGKTEKKRKNRTQLYYVYKENYYYLTLVSSLYVLQWPNGHIYI